MSRIHLGTVKVWPDAKKALDPSDVDAALRRHEGGHCEEADLRTRWFNLLGLLGKSGFWSDHRDRNGTRFAVITDNQSVPNVTLVVLRTW